MNKTIIFGSASGMGKNIASLLAQKGKHLILVSRDAPENEMICKDLTTRYANKNEYYTIDIQDLHRTKLIITEILKDHSDIERLYYVTGYLGDQPTAQKDMDEQQMTLNVNFTHTAYILERFADHFQKNQNGKMAIFSSVAGDRGRASNYVYGSAKAGLTAYASGLRARLSQCGVHVLIVKPGFLDTAMTYGLPGMFLVANPKDIALKVFKALEQGKNVIYTPWFWRWIMLIIKSIPETIFKKLPL
jgi:short-subunit dehydrogenase